MFHVDIMVNGIKLFNFLSLNVGIENLPFELQRNFNLMRDLDQRTEGEKSKVNYECGFNMCECHLHNILFKSIIIMKNMLT